MYNNQPLIFVNTEAQRQTLEGQTGFSKDKTVIFVGDTKKFYTHNVEFDGNNTDTNTVYDDTAVVNRLNNLDGNASDSLKNKVAAIEALVFDTDNDQHAEMLEDLYNLVGDLKGGADNISNTVVNNVNNHMDEINYWYTYTEQQEQ